MYCRPPLLIPIWGGLVCFLRLFLLQRVGVYCGSLSMANVESCGSHPRGMCPCITIVLPTHPPGQGDDILWGGVRTHIGAIHTSCNPHLLHFSWGILVWIALKTCWSFFVNILGIVLFTPLSSLVLTTFAYFFSQDQFLWLHWSAVLFFLTRWHWLQPPVWCYWLENIVLVMTVWSLSQLALDDSAMQLVLSELAVLQCFWVQCIVIQCDPV